ncbi:MULTISPECIES: DUF6069 family protein [Haloferax]|uniref:Uncharacterized protein n=1 Tax=Haloferax marinum TaxID=2666143 RepID=A0A6A8G5H8_9EURY|nr:MULTISPECIES: DUF6069 family protein [Haloferax]KAB1197241.1 hypothetical protein Hfx1150_06795 [Haloferax sp. CBA1150]MRW96279.1 hypothetical protein [Haloferax marinum]
MSTITPTVRPTRSVLVRRGLTAVALSLAANALVLALVLASGAVQPFAPLSYPSVLFLSGAGAVGATLVYGYLTTRVENPDRTFLRVALAVLVVSFLPDIGLLFGDPQATIPGVLVLMAMHVVVAGVCVGTLTKIGREPDAV